MAATFPTVSVEVSFSTGPVTTPSWTAISNYARAFSSRRGRQVELGRVEAGTATVRLNNQDRRFDPTYTIGAYYPNVKPMKRTRIQATWNSQTYPVYTGYVERWPQTWRLNGKMAEIELPLVDAFATALTYGILSKTYLLQYSGERIDEVLNDIGWGTVAGGLIDSGVIGTMTVGASGDRLIAQGVVLLGGYELNGSAYDLIQAVVQSENGLFFIARDGTAIFYSRQYGPGASLATFGDATGELPYVDMSFEEMPIINESHLTSDITSTEVVEADATSQANYFRRVESLAGFQQASDSELSGLAGYRVSRYKDPVYRISSIIINPQRSPALLWPQVLGRELGDTITVNRQPPGGTQKISQLSVIEGIEHDVTPDQWLTRFWLSAADLNTYFILGDAILGRIDSGRLGY